jgi:hypothetical protein
MLPYQRRKALRHRSCALPIKQQHLDQGYRARELAKAEQRGHVWAEVDTDHKPEEITASPAST